MKKDEVGRAISAIIDTLNTHIELTTTPDFLLLMPADFEAKLLTMKTPVPDMVEGPEAWNRFNSVMKKVLTVPRAAIQRKVTEHRKEVDANPNRRGPRFRRLQKFSLPLV